MIKIFIGGGGEGDNSKRCLSGVVGMGGHKKLFIGGGDTEGANTPAPSVQPNGLHSYSFIAIFRNEAFVHF